MKGDMQNLREGCFEKSAAPCGCRVRTPDPSPEVGPDKENPGSIAFTGKK